MSACFADVTSDDEPVVPVAELGDGLVQPLVVEARTVDDRSVCGQPEDAGSGIAGLGLGRDRTDLDESEAQGRKFAERFSVAVETRRQTDRVGNRSPNTSRSSEGCSVRYMARSSARPPGIFPIMRNRNRTVL